MAPAATVTERQYQGRVHEESRRLMADWMAALGRAEAEGQATGALMISGNCVELLRACHVLPMFPEVTALQNAGSRGTQLHRDITQYVAGINAYIAHCMGSFPINCPGEYVLTGHLDAITGAGGPEPFTVTDLIAISGVVGGLFGSLKFDTPSGPSIVVAALGLFILSLLTRPRTGGAEHPAASQRGPA